MHIFLVSGGFHGIVDHVAKELDIPLENVFANRLLFDDNGKDLQPIFYLSVNE